MSILRALLGIVSILVLTPAARGVPCTGDCGADRAVTVDEIVRGVGIALGDAALEVCARFDANADGRLTIEELVASVRALLAGCTLPTAIVFSTHDIASAAAPPHTPGSPGVAVTNANLVTQLGEGFSLNNARYTRHRLDENGLVPDAVLILVPGFEGGAGTFKILAENLIGRAAAERELVLEVWAFDRRGNQLEDGAGLEIAETLQDPQVALDWLFGAELGLDLHPARAPLGRRAFFHDPQADVPFIADWTPLVFSQDIDAVVEAARGVARDANVFLGGHSAGTGFTARYAATDFNLSGEGAPEPGHAKLRGLVLLEGGGDSTAGAPLTDDALDRIIAKADGGLFGAVRDNAPRCVDGTTPCTIATEAADCAGQTPPKCTPPTTAYAIVPGVLNPRILASAEPVGIQGITDPDGGAAILQVDQGGIPTNNAITQVPDLAPLALLGPGTVQAGFGGFLDDDGLVASFAPFLGTSLGVPGPTVDDVVTWLDIVENPAPSQPDNGPQPTALPPRVWGQEVEVTNFERLIPTFYAGGTNFTDLYYPSSGLSTTSAAGVCTAGTCSAGNVGAACGNDAACAQAIRLDSSALSIGRGRRDIESLTEAANIAIPVIAFGGSNGLTPVPGTFTPFAQSIGACAAASCDGTPRVVDPALPNPAFPTFGGVAGGFEVYISEGYAHVDVVTAEDGPHNQVIAPLLEFLARNVASGQ
jgi:hypothetical protein